MTNYTQAQSTQASAVATLFKSTYMQMAAALAVTGLTAYFLSASEAYITMLETSMAPLFIAGIAEILLVMWITARLGSMSMTTATLLFILYSVLNGVTLGTIFLIYTPTSIAATFFATAGTFLAMSIIGYITRLDLSKVGSLLTMLLIGIIIATVVNIFVQSSGLYWFITYAGVVVFVGLTAWDTQKLKQIYTQHNAVDESGQKLALLGALVLYLDFINLFLFLLRILGDRR